MPDPGAGAKRHPHADAVGHAHPTKSPTCTPTRTRVPAVCGAVLENVPPICSLKLTPNVVTVPLSTVTLSFGLADRDGGVNMLCYGIAVPPVVPDPNRCRPFAPPGAPINRRGSFQVTLPPLARGTYTFAIVVTDSAGNRSHTASTALQVL